MQASKSAIIEVVLLSMMLVDVCGKAVLKMQWISYSNRDGEKWDGQCCDVFCNACDHRFEMCFDTISGSSDVRSCSYFHHATSKYLNRNDVSFGHDLSSLANPFDVMLDKWQTGVKFKVEVIDDDISYHDLVDTLYYTIVSRPSPSEARASYTQKVILGSRTQAAKTSLTVRYMVYCATDYYGEDCSHFCKAKDSETQGHYTCDPDTGDRVCLPGWKDPATNCKQEADECKESPCLNDGTCVDEFRNYECQCIPGYTGKNCEVDIDECESGPCLNGGTCVDHLNKFTCNCPKDRVGRECQFHICLTDNFCQNGGTCYGDGECVCGSGFVGERCQLENVNSPLPYDGTAKQTFPVWASILIALFVVLVITASIIVLLVMKHRKKAEIKRIGQLNPAYTPHDIESPAQHRGALVEQQQASQQAQLAAASNTYENPSELTSGSERGRLPALPVDIVAAAKASALEDDRYKHQPTTQPF